MKNTKQIQIWVSATGLSLLFGVSAAGAAPDGMYVYPQKGQSDAQKNSDDHSCSDWAKSETSFDPAQGPAAVHSDGARQGDGLRGAARGAAAGAIIGAIAGDAGKGAAIGAGAGAVHGRGRMRGAEQARNDAVSQSNADYARGMDKFKRAYSACMSARGYSVN